jgi:hypothetical protein
LRGYQSHLSQTQDPLCRAVFDRLKKSYETYQLLEQAANPSDELEENPDIDMELGLADENRHFEDGFEEVADEEEPEDDYDESDSENMDTELEAGWEPPRNGAPQEDTGGLEEEPADIRSDLDASNLDEEKSDLDNDLPQRNFDRYVIGDGYGVKPAARVLYNDKYPSSLAGKALSREESHDYVYGTSLGGGDNPWAPFRSKKDWEIARWAKLRGVGSTAFSEVLAIDGVSYPTFFSFLKINILKVREDLDLSYKNSNELNKIIDLKLPGRPQFKRREIVQSGEVVELYSRDIIECLRALWGDPEFSEDLILEPERLYADEDMTIRMFHEMNSGKWWWDTQVRINSSYTV